MDKIKEFMKELKTLRGEKGYCADWDSEAILEKQIFDYEESLGEGLKAGRILQIPYADGYAMYWIKDIKPRTVSLIHLPLGDAWEHPMVINNKVSKTYAEQCIARKDAIKRMFKGSK